MDLKPLIRTIPDFPEPGIQFKDVESITENPAAFRWVIEQFAAACARHPVDKIVALDARGFLFGAALGLHLGLPMVMARKHGKLGGHRVSEQYALEYGTAEVEMQSSAINAGERIVVVDDLLATGGTALAAQKLVEKLGAQVVLFTFVIELAELAGRERLGDPEVLALVEF